MNFYITCENINFNNIIYLIILIKKYKLEFEL